MIGLDATSSACSAGCCTNQNKIRLIAVDDVTAYNVETVRKMAPVGNQDK